MSILDELQAGQTPDPIVLVSRPVTGALMAGTYACALGVERVRRYRPPNARSQAINPSGSGRNPSTDQHGIALVYSNSHSHEQLVKAPMLPQRVETA
jgi:hypothetical protein